MDHDNQMTALPARIASAETERDTWRSAGMQRAIAPQLRIAVSMNRSSAISTAGLGRPALRMNFEDRKHLQQEELKRQARCGPRSVRRWAKFTDGEIDQISSERDQLVGRIQNSYDLSKADANRQLRHWESRPRD